MAPVTDWLTWREAMARALYGDIDTAARGVSKTGGGTQAGGFYRRPGAGPAAHFRTSAHNPVFAEAVGRLLLQVDARLGGPEPLHFVDMAAGRGELAAGVAEWVAAEAPDTAKRLRTIAVDFGPRPEGLPETVDWAALAPDGVVGLLFANEWLDNVVCDVAEVDADGVIRLVEVDAASGTERLGAEPDPAQQAWLARWWPLDGADTGFRAELGLDRDAAWRSAVGGLERGVAVAVDYSHALAARPRFGTLTGYRDGHQVPPVPDGSCDITAHVALDACAAALTAGIKTVLTTQRDHLRSLGVAGTRPDLSQASTDPLGYLRGLSRASAAAELTDPAGLGAFGWLLAFSGY